jgi:cysteine desulfurase
VTVYLDHAASAPLRPEVLEQMLPLLAGEGANPSSPHGPGRRARAALDGAHERLAATIGAEPRAVVFTGGGTEAINLALKGAAWAGKAEGHRIVTTAVEHKAVLESCLLLEKYGFEVTRLPVDRYGRVDPDDLGAALTDKTILVSLQLANNEVGTIQPIAEIGKLTRARSVLLHCDAVQGVGKTPFDVEAMNVDLASITAHKIYGPKGVGALYVRRARPRVRLVAQMDGGGHERGNRSGTLNVPGIVGFAKACELMMTEGAAENERVLGLRNRLENKIKAELDHVILNGDREHRLPGNLNLSFAFVEGEGLMMAIKDVAVSSGSACTSASLEPSYVLKAMGLDEDLAHSSLRFGIGRFNTEEEVDYVADLVIRKVKKLRDISPLYEMHQQGIDLKSIQWAAH